MPIILSPLSDAGIKCWMERLLISIFDQFDMPACAATLGWTLLDADGQTGAIKVRFDGKKDFCNPAGNIQGGFLTAMLDDTMGPTVLVKSAGHLYSATIHLAVNFIAPARCGQLIGFGYIVNLGKTIAHLRGELFDTDSRLVATATASARVMAMSKIIRER